MKTLKNNPTTHIAIVPSEQLGSLCVYVGNFYKMEIFKTIGIATNYEVSNLGVVKNKITGKIMKPFLVTKGYVSVGIMVDKYNRIVTVKLHRLVAETFIGKKIGLVIDHIDNDKTNNRANNLVYVTNRYNILKRILSSSGGFTQKNKNSSTIEYRKGGKRFSFSAKTEMECVLHYCNEMADIDFSVVELLEKHYNFKFNKPSINN